MEPWKLWSLQTRNHIMVQVSELFGHVWSYRTGKGGGEGWGENLSVPKVTGRFTNMSVYQRPVRQSKSIH